MITTETITTLKCDTCPQKSYGPKTQAEVWAFATKWGWQWHDGRHLCPGCVARLKIQAAAGRDGAA